MEDEVLNFSTFFILHNKPYLSRLTQGRTWRGDPHHNFLPITPLSFRVFTANIFFFL